MAHRPERLYIQEMIDSLPRSPASSAICFALIFRSNRRT
jgi:hypothetical protein